MNNSQQPISHEEKERFLQLILPLRNRLLQYAQAVTNSREERDDLVGDTILAALQGFGKLEREGAFATWLFTIASRIEKRKRERGRRFQQYDAETDPEGVPSDYQNPDVGPDITALYRAIEQLPSEQREAIALYEISGLSLEEIREIQGGSLSAVKMRLVRGRKRLAKLLGAIDEGESNTNNPTMTGENEERTIQTA
ncbi:MAG: RNA polymerase sigma factor [Ignavibacteriae bacterium]|nr:RNA polymerase sigma factor [Ignavibacteriota bacterium]MCB9214867.1 RNA polymerase sigma factor [Ignavibacteria bacterium]